MIVGSYLVYLVQLFFSITIVSKSIDFNSSGLSTHSSGSISSTPLRSPSDTLTRAEFFHDEHDALKFKYECLKIKIKNNNTNEEDDNEYRRLIKDFGKDRLYDATKLLFETAYEEDEILSHTVSGKKANTKVVEVKPKFSPHRFGKIRGALQQICPELLNDSTVLTKKITAVQKRLKLDKAKREQVQPPAI